MDAMDVCSANKNRLKKLNNLFSKFSDVAIRINELNSSIIPSNVSNETRNALFAKYGNESMEQKAEYSGELNAFNVAHRNAWTTQNDWNNISGTNNSYDGMNMISINGGCYNEQDLPSCTRNLDYVSGQEIVELDVGTRRNTYLKESQVVSRVMDIEVRDDSAFIEERLERILNKEESGSLKNYFYYLYDETDSLDRFSDAGTGNQIIHQTKAGADASDTETPTVDISDCDSNSCIANEIGSTEWSEEQASDSEMLTVDILDSDSNSCIANEISSPDFSGVWYTSETIVEATDTATLGIDVRSENQQKSMQSYNEPYRMKGKPGRGCDKSKMFVSTSNMGPYTKKYCCCYCLKRYYKLDRHLATVHKDEEDVKTFVALPIASKMRGAAIAKLRRKGRSTWNSDAELNKGDLDVCRRPNEIYQRNAMEFEECEACGEYLRSTGMRRHWNVCTGNPLPGERCVKEFSRLVEGRLHVEASQDLHTVFSGMSDDEEIAIIRFDWIVIAYGNDLCINLWRDYQLRVIKTKLRNAGKLLIASKSICPDITDVASLYHVSNCNTLVGAVRMIAGFDSDTKAFKSPGTASTLVTLVNAIGELLLIEYMKRDDEEKEKAVDRFLTVFQKEARIKINKAVAVTQSNVRRENIEIIPSTDDVGKLADYLDRERLAKLTLMSVLVYNRKRVGDTQNIYVKQFQNRQFIADIKDDIPQEIRENVKSKMTIRAKLWRTVSVLLKHHFDECLELLIFHRSTAGVPVNNTYLFGLPSKSGKILKIDACTLFRTYSSACGAEDPASLRGTKLRKHFASTCASLDLTDNDVTNVAKFMGHSDKIHRDVYRHNTLHREVVQISNLLEIAQGRSSVDKITANDTIGTSNTKGKIQRKRKLERTAAAKKPLKKAKIELSNAKTDTNKPQRRIKNQNCSNDKVKVPKRGLNSNPHARSYK
ncbi:uncharacterized protein LOC119085748 isoform X2 [Bradysia coprophila]|uniref:uncharacterized protein LOC119085748 isoform X2 n=1 Tax=Bradysia coprophila TaxID=38358 RepID=UPI00187DD80E|nr:uncharacterized protein LOC119085748 isoform X2 [Bradysia coprophila]